jgi:YfiH family protein
VKQHVPVDTVVPLLKGVQGIRSGISVKPVDASDRTTARSWAARAAGVAMDQVGMLEQIHGHAVVRAPWSGFPDPVEGDALVTDLPELALCVRVADCTPLALSVDDGSAIAIVHGGWRGVYDGIVGDAVGVLCDVSGGGPEVVRAALGPTIGLCCYEVGEEFKDRFSASLLHRREEQLYLDLPGAIAVALEQAGVPPTSIDINAGCTVCGRGSPPEPEFHSHRASHGAPGRNIAFIVKESSA